MAWLCLYVIVSIFCGAALSECMTVAEAMDLQQRHHIRHINIPMTTAMMSCEMDGNAV
jgi:hypothetical protein